MKKNSIYIFISILILLVFVVGRYFLKNDSSGYFKNYNRVISEPDSINVIGDDL